MSEWRTCVVCQGGVPYLLQLWYESKLKEINTLE
jgi:hypothetical protein